MKSFKEFINEIEKEAGDVLEHTGKSKRNEWGTKYDKIHDHPDVKPQKLSSKHISIIRKYTYTEGSSDNRQHPHNSRNMNSVLRHEAEKKGGKPEIRRWELVS